MHDLYCVRDYVGDVDRLLTGMLYDMIIEPLLEL
jgi:hypothetical protein